MPELRIYGLSEEEMVLIRRRARERGLTQTQYGRALVRADIDPARPRLSGILQSREHDRDLVDLARRERG